MNSSSKSPKVKTTAEKSAPVAPKVKSTAQVSARAISPASPVPYVSEDSPIIQLQSLSQAVINSSGVAHDAFTKVGLYALGGTDIQTRVTELQEVMCTDIGESLTNVSSAASSIALARSISIRFEAYLEAVVEGIDVGTDSDCVAEDREGFAADKTYVGRRVSDEYTDLCENLRRVRRLLDQISISVFGSPVELDEKEKSAIDTESLGILAMLNGAIQNMDSTRAMLDAVVYRINEAM